MSKKELETILNSHFNLSVENNELDTESEYFKRLQALLAQRVEILIRTDIDKLLQILYRIDVHQKDSDQAFDLGEVKKISLKLAEKIINRQLQKVDYAKKFYKRD